MKIYLTIIFLLSHFTLFSQNEIQLKNPSFEKEIAHSTVPNEWLNCGFLQHSTVDLHGAYSDFFEVQQSPQDGDTYVGMIIREDNTWEAIGQKLQEPMLRNVQYQFSIYLALAKNYISPTQSSYIEKNFNQAGNLRIWGGNSRCDRGQLLAESLPITHHDWQEYIFEFEPKEDWEYLILEVYFDEDVAMIPYNGNLLMDNCSIIVPYQTIQLSTITDYNDLTERELLYLITQCKKDDANLQDTSIIDIIYDSWLFEQTSYELGIRDLISNIDSIQLIHYYSVYQTLDVKEPIEIMKKTLVLHKKDSNLLHEVRFLKKCQKQYEKALRRENINDKRLKYIQLHRTKIITFLKKCKF